MYIYLILVLFVFSVIIGFSFAENFSFFDNILMGLGDSIEGLGHGGLIWFIFQNNISSAFIAMILGVFLGIAPVFNSLINGALLGYVYAKAIVIGGPGVILYILPHGIFELPAIFIALGLGLKFGMFIFAKKGEKINEFRRRFWNSIKVFLTIILPLLIIAAVIEGSLIFLIR